MKGQAYIVVGSISGTGGRLGGISGNAAAFGMATGGGRNTLPTVRGEGERTRESDLMRWLRVTPTEPQQLVWLVPQYGIDYQIETSTELEWNIK